MMGLVVMLMLVDGGISVCLFLASGNEFPQASHRVHTCMSHSPLQWETAVEGGMEDGRHEMLRDGYVCNVTWHVWE